MEGEEYKTRQSPVFTVTEFKVLGLSESIPQTISNLYSDGFKSSRTIRIHTFSISDMTHWAFLDTGVFLKENKTMTVNERLKPKYTVLG